MAYNKWKIESHEAYDKKVADLLSSLNPSMCKIHFGTANSKTRMVNEGTSAGPCGTCDKSCIGDCREGCYAIVHGDGIYPLARQNHAENTIMRRLNPIAYYTAFFRFAMDKKANLRINETGDFETLSDLFAFYTCAMMFPSVRVIGYTKRVKLLEYIAHVNQLQNVTIHFSVACNGMGKEEAEKYGVPVTKITFDKAMCNCPFQVAKMNGGKVKWACNMCANNGCGCFAKKDVYFLAH